jgi:hypothetical protein
MGVAIEGKAKLLEGLAIPLPPTILDTVKEADRLIFVVAGEVHSWKLRPLSIRIWFQALSSVLIFG